MPGPRGPFSNAERHVATAPGAPVFFGSRPSTHGKGPQGWKRSLCPAQSEKPPNPPRLTTVPNGSKTRAAAVRNAPSPARLARPRPTTLKMNGVRAPFFSSACVPAAAKPPCAIGGPAGHKKNAPLPKRPQSVLAPARLSDRAPILAADLSCKIPGKTASEPAFFELSSGPKSRVRATHR